MKITLDLRDPISFLLLAVLILLCPIGLYTIYLSCLLTFIPQLTRETTGPILWTLVLKQKPENIIHLFNTIVIPYLALKDGLLRFNVEDH